MAGNPILLSWERFFPEVPPAGFLLRKSHPERWLRFHTLPDAKRIPKGASEVEQALQRMKSLCGDIFQPHSPTALWVAGFSHPSQPFPKTQLKDFDAVTEQPLPWKEALQEYVDVRHMKVWVRIGEWDWKNVAFFFREASLDRLAYVTAFSPLTGTAICPYDGGIDLFSRDDQQRARLTEKFKTWLP